jgi:hypothetical protein
LNYNKSRFNGFLFFMQQLTWKRMVMVYKHCRVLHKESNKIGFAFFFIMLWFSTNFTRIGQTPTPLKIHIYRQDPGKFLFFTDIPLIYEKLPGKIRGSAMSPLGAAVGGSRRIPARSAAEWRGKGKGTTRSSPWVGLGPEMGRGRRRRPCAVEPGGGGRNSLNSDESRGGAGQCAMVGAPEDPRGCSGTLVW